MQGEDDGSANAAGGLKAVDEKFSESELESGVGSAAVLESHDGSASEQMVGQESESELDTGTDDDASGSRDASGRRDPSKRNLGAESELKSEPEIDTGVDGDATAPGRHRRGNGNGGRDSANDPGSADGVANGTLDDGLSDDEGPECRVCRGDDEGGRRPLAHPCACRGSIKYVHQDCLVEWLKSRRGGAGGGGGGGAGQGEDTAALQAQRCELCREKLVFRAKYRAGAPAQLGLSQFIRGALRRATPPLMHAVKGALNVTMWGVGLPMVFCVLFRLGIGVALLFAQEVSAFVGGDEVDFPRGGDAMRSSPGVTTTSPGLPGLVRIWRGGWLDLLSDWCCGVSLMIAVMCLSPPCVEGAVEFVGVMKALPLIVEGLWHNQIGVREAFRDTWRIIMLGHRPPGAQVVVPVAAAAVDRVGQDAAVQDDDAVPGQADAAAAAAAAAAVGGGGVAEVDGGGGDGGPDEGGGVGGGEGMRGDAAAGGDGAAEAEAGAPGEHPPAAEAAAVGGVGAAAAPPVAGIEGVGVRGRGRVGNARAGVLGMLDKLEWMLLGALEQLAAPPREEDGEGEGGQGFFLWGWPAVGTAGGCLAFMGLLTLVFQTIPYAAYHATTGIMGPYLRPHPRYHGQRGAAHNPQESWNSVRRNFSAITAVSRDKRSVRYHYLPENFLRKGYATAAAAAAAALEGADGNGYHERRKRLSFGFGVVEQNDWVVDENGLYPRGKHASVGGLLGNPLGGVDMRSRPVPNRLGMDVIFSSGVRGGDSKRGLSAGRRALVAPTRSLDTWWGVYSLEAPVVSSARPGAGEQVVGMAPPAVLVVPSGAGYHSGGTGRTRKGAMLGGRWVLMEWQLRGQWGTMAVLRSDGGSAVSAAPAGGVVGIVSASAKGDGSTSGRSEAAVAGDGLISSVAKPTPPSSTDDMSGSTGDRSTLPGDEPATSSGGKSTSTSHYKPTASSTDTPTSARRDKGGTPDAERGSSNNVVDEEIDLERYLGGTNEQVDKGGWDYRIHVRFLAEVSRWSSNFFGKSAFPLTSVLYEGYHAPRNKRHQQQDGGSRGSVASIGADTNAEGSSGDGGGEHGENGLGKSSSVSYSRRRHDGPSASASEATDDGVGAEFLETAAAAVEDAYYWTGRGHTGSAAGDRGDGGVFPSGRRESERRSDFSAAAAAAAAATDRRRLVDGGDGGGSDVQGAVWSVWVATVEGWWRAAIAFFPVIPGTDGLLSAEAVYPAVGHARVAVALLPMRSSGESLATATRVLCETAQGHALLAIYLGILCLIFSVVRVQFQPRNPHHPPVPQPNIVGGGVVGARGVGGRRGLNLVPPGGGGWVGGLGMGGGPVLVDGRLVLDGRVVGGAGGGGMIDRDPQVGLDLKVLTMGILELLCLPLWVGVFADFFSLPVMATSAETRLAWALANPISSIALHWGAGSMAVGIVGCLGRELRRALKPNLLPEWAIRPPEHGLEEVIARMTHEPILAQMQGYVVSAIAFPMALSLMIMVPAYGPAFVASTWPAAWSNGTSLGKFFSNWKIAPVVLGIGEPTQGDRLGMDLVLFHFILPVVMEHLKIRGPVRRVVCWVLTTACGLTGARDMLLHPVLAAGRGAGANDPEELDDLPPLPENPPEPANPAGENAPDILHAVEPDQAGPAQEVEEVPANIANEGAPEIRNPVEVGPNWRNPERLNRAEAAAAAVERRAAVVAARAADIPNPGREDAPEAPDFVARGEAELSIPIQGRAPVSDAVRVVSSILNEASEIAPDVPNPTQGSRGVHNPVGGSGREVPGPAVEYTWNATDRGFGVENVPVVPDPLEMPHRVKPMVEIPNPVQVLNLVTGVGNGEGEMRDVGESVAERPNPVERFPRPLSAVRSAADILNPAWEGAPNVSKLDEPDVPRKSDAAGEGQSSPPMAAEVVANVLNQAWEGAPEIPNLAGEDSSKARNPAEAEEDLPAGLGEELVDIFNEAWADAAGMENPVEEDHDPNVPSPAEAGEEGVIPGPVAGVEDILNEAWENAPEIPNAAAGAEEGDRIQEEEVDAGGGGGWLVRTGEGVRVLVACGFVCGSLTVIPAATVLMPLLTGRYVFRWTGLPLDDDLPPIVAGAIVCLATASAMSALIRLQVAAGERGRVLWGSLVLAGKWVIVGTLLLGALPALTGLLVHDALRGPLVMAEETAALTWGKIWALGLVCVKVWARIVMAGGLGGEDLRARLRRVRANGIWGVDFRYTLTQVCIPLLDRVGQYYFWPHLTNRFVLPLLCKDQRDLHLLQKGTPFVFLLARGVWAAIAFTARKMRALHDRIRDDEYLEGLELENMPPQGRS